MTGEMRSSGFQYGASVLLLIVLPILGPACLLDRWLVQSEQEAVRQLEISLDYDLQHIMFRADPKEILVRLFQETFRRLEKRRFSPAPLAKMSLRIPPHLGLQIACFSPDGTMVPLKGTDLASRYVVGKFWTDLRRRVADQKRVRMFRNVFGNGLFMGDLFDREAVPFRIGPGSLDGALIWKGFGSAGGLLMFFPGFPAAHLNLDLILKARSKTSFYAVMDPASRKKRLWGTPFKGWKQALSQASLVGGGTVLCGSSLCRVVRHPDGLWLMRAQSVKPLLEKDRRLFLWVVTGVLLVFFLRRWNRSGGAALIQLKLSPRLLLLFLLALCLPGGLMIGLSIGTFQERETVLERNIHEEHLARVRSLDLAFETRLENLRRFFRWIRDHPRVRSGSKKAIVDFGERLNKQHRIAYLDVRDIRGKAIGNLDKSGVGETTNKLFMTHILRRYLQSPIPESTDELEILASKVLLSPRWGLAKVIDRPDALIPLALADKSILLYWDAFPPKGSDPAAVLLMAQHYRAELEAFLKDGIPPGLFAYDSTVRRWWPEHPRFPGVEMQAAQALLAKKGSVRSAPFQGGQWLGTVFPSSMIKDVCFFAISDLAPVRSEMALYKQRFFVFFLLMLVIAFLFARFLTRSLLKPIGDLSRGIAALERRDLKYRLPDPGNDEFGRLSVAFNHMLEDARELDLAREVQRKLLPASLPQLETYELGYVSETLTELGGDYCDVIPGADGKLSLIVGDVTGHGISAALLMAMAKTVCLLSVREGLPIPRLLERMNLTANQAAQKTKLLTMVVAVLDEKTHCLEWCSAGHPYSFLRKPDGTTLSLKMPNMPLGARPKGKWNTEKLFLEPGDSVLFYTDGLAEAANSRKEMFSFVRLEKAFGAFGHLPPDSVMQNIIAEVRRHVGDQPLNDDITMMVLRRKDG